MNSPSSALLRVDRLRSGYHEMPVLREISLEVDEGSCLGLLGHNGMGKTTLLRTIMGFVPAAGGHIHFDGTEITSLPPWRRARLGLSYVPQGRGILPDLTVRENLALAFAADEAGDDEAVAVERIAARFAVLESLLDRPGGTLSGGEQQILALARAYMADPILLLLDEPTEGIQPSIVADIASTLNETRRRTGLAILLVEQNEAFLHEVSDHVLYIENGQTVPAKPTETRPPRPPPLADSRREEPPSGSTSSPAEPAGPVPNEMAKHGNSADSETLEATMTVRRPTMAQLQRVAEDLQFEMSGQRLAAFLRVMEPTFLAYDQVAAMPDELPPVAWPRTPGHRPPASENPLNAWIVKCEVQGAPKGPLAGRKIVLKDNICLSGVPMTNGSSTLEGYVPNVDATVASRILDAGGAIVGKAHCECFCLSGGSHTNAFGPVRNPWKPDHSAGGSSSGCGALVGSGEVEMAVGGDQGGSIRIPSSWSGCYGMKPTHGLVPYTGIFPIETTIDHAGPMTTNVADNALLLEVIAGEDGLDPRQYAPRTERYTNAIGRGVSGLRMGVLEEGFGLPESEADVDELVRRAAAQFGEHGAIVESTSIPMHRCGAAIWTPIALEGLTRQMMEGNGFGTGWEGLYVTSLLDMHAGWRGRTGELSDSLKISMLIGAYMLKHYRGHYYAKAQNLSRSLRQAYDRAFQQFDLLLLPTIPMKATPLPPQDASLDVVIQRAFEMIANTCPFDATGHPAMNVPCGLSGGLPVGMMLVGRHCDESTIYRAADAFARRSDWRGIG